MAVETDPVANAAEAPVAGVKRSLSDEEDNEERPSKGQRRDHIDKRSRQCPYLDTINRSVLDFDFEKLCSVSLSHINVYACLVCGKYFQGRGIKSHAYTHSVQDGHHVFLNLETQKFYCLPDNYEIIDSSLDDIIYVLNPTFTPERIAKLDTSQKLCRAYDGTTYLPGIVGLNNIKANDYCNVILHIQLRPKAQTCVATDRFAVSDLCAKHHRLAGRLVALSHVPPLRSFFLVEQNYAELLRRPSGNQMLLLVQRFGELVRKLWNLRNFKAHVSPHEMLQAVTLCSKKRFRIVEQGDPIEFVSWLLNSLHVALGGSKKLSSSMLNKTFRGKMKIYSRKIPPSELSEEEKQSLLLMPEYSEVVEESQFLYLTCDLPPMPLYPDELQENIIPQVPLVNILSKFNGVTEKEYKTYKDSTMKRFEITRLPPYIIVYIKRFTKNVFILEKNRTIVNFPIKNIDFGELLSEPVRAKHPCTTYNMVANIVHDGEPGPGKGTYRAHILHRGTGKWYELQDLHVADVLPQMITLSESYIQIYELDPSIRNQPVKTQEPMAT